MAYRNYDVANGFIVDPSGNGDYTTITSAIAAASSGKTIYIRPGTYTENFTLTPGVNLCASGSDSSLNGTGNVKVIGKLSMTGSGTSTVYGIQFQTNSDYAIEITGASSSLNLNNCFVNCTNNTGIHFHANGVGTILSIEYCNIAVNNTGISAFNIESFNTLFGNVYISFSYIYNNVNSTTPSNISGATVQINSSVLYVPINMSSVSELDVYNSSISSLSNTIALNLSGSALLSCFYCFIYSGTAACINTTVSNSRGRIFNCTLLSSNSSSITGTGPLDCEGNLFNTNYSSPSIAAAAAQGIIGIVPSSGALGQQIRSYIPSGSAVSLTTATPANITSILLNPGTWDVSAIGAFSGSLTGTQSIISISSTSATLDTATGDSTVNSPSVALSTSNLMLTVPSYRVFITTNTTYYLVAQSTFTIGTATAYGRISATRVG